MTKPEGDPIVEPTAAPAPAGPVPDAKKKGGLPLAIVFGVLGAGLAGAAVMMSRGVAVPHAASPAAASARPAAAPRVVAASDIAPSRWTAGGRWVSDRQSVAFELKASNRVSVWMGQVQPSLVVRCLAKRTEVFVYTETAARIEPGMDDRAVRVRFDDEPYVDERWPDSEEHKGLFAPSGETFAQRLLDAKTLRFQFTPHNAETAEVEFSVAGLRDMMSPVQKKCGWAN